MAKTSKFHSRNLYARKFATEKNVEMAELFAW